MTVSVSNVNPQRMRGTDDPTIILTGTGFDATPANNDVLVGGSSGTITGATTTKIDFTLPAAYVAGTIRNTHVACQVINLITGESAYFWIRIKADIDEVADYVIESAIPGPFEQVTPTPAERPRYFEARDMERLASLLEAWTRDIAAGHVLTQDANGLAVPGGTPGRCQILEVDLAEATDLKWALQQDTMLPFGGELDGANVLLQADGDRGDPVGTGGSKQWAPVGGTIDIAWLHYVGAGTLDRVRILVNTAVQYDSGAGLAIATLGVWTAAPAVVVVAGDEIEIDATRTGGGTDSVVGGCRLVLE